MPTSMPSTTTCGPKSVPLEAIGSAEAYGKKNERALFTSVNMDGLAAMLLSMKRRPAVRYLVNRSWQASRV